MDSNVDKIEQTVQKDNKNKKENLDEEAVKVSFIYLQIGTKKESKRR